MNLNTRRKRGLVSVKKLKMDGDRHYINAYLWRDLSSFHRYSSAGRRHELTREPGGIAVACHTPMQYKISYQGKKAVSKAPPKLGEVHFVRNAWDINTVVHELTHAAIYRLRATVLNKPYCSKDFMETYEEPICYAVGTWADQLYRWLWKMNPSHKWKKS